ncbi:beta-tectorin-like isoform X1 [Xiphophorus maculatus]|uniref:beta-tectorin-like isoform X1 n=1 Tax=Xiphophorus maculatus TaxID=8083 RepID=UPI000C6E4D60|nr:beta-tectorin-like isoform X1 [Xiphophorus maculatus]
MASFVALLLSLPVALTCAPQKADYVVVSCFPNAIIANVPECPYGWEIDQLSLGGVCYTGIHSPGYYRFIIPDLTPRNHSYCGTQSEYMPGKDAKYVFYNSIVSNDTSLTVRNQPVNYTFSCVYRAAYLVNNAVFSQSVFTKPSAFFRVATVYVNNGSLGTFRSQLSMNVFTNSKFLYAKDAPYVIDTSEIGSEVFIGIEAKGLSNRFKVVINNCWATPTPYSTDRKRWSLIINSCPADYTVTIFDNAKDSRSTFKFNSFRFQRLEKVSTVWLHCEVHICDAERLVCQPSPCSKRSLSSEIEPSGGILTTEFQVKASESSNNGHTTGTSFLIPLMVTVNIFFDLVNASKI